MWDVLKDYPAARVRLEAIAVKRLEKYKKAPLEKVALPRSESTPGLVESRGKVSLEEMWVSPLPLNSASCEKSFIDCIPVDHLDKLSTAHQGMTESPCSDLSTRSQSMTDKDVAGGNTIAISSISVLSSHGYNNEVYNSANSAARQHSTCTRPLKQLVVMTGNGNHHRFHHSHSHGQHNYPSTTAITKGPSSTPVHPYHSNHNSDCPTATCNPPSLSFPGGVVAIDASAVDIEASTNIIEDQKKEELLLEIHHLRERIKCLETDNASMHTKLSKEQKNVNQRLAEIEMQINDEDFSFFETNSQRGNDESEESQIDENEINQESFI